VTDPLKIIATPLTTVAEPDTFNWLKDYFGKEEVEKVLVGYPLNLKGGPTDATAAVDRFIERFRKLFPGLELEPRDEAFTSKMAVRTLVESGLKKKDRQRKELVDQTSAAILLQEYLQNL
jgi:putative Holliday junction resolvase